MRQPHPRKQRWSGRPRYGSAGAITRVDARLRTAFHHQREVREGCTRRPPCQTQEVMPVDETVGGAPEDTSGHTRSSRRCGAKQQTRATPEEELVARPHPAIKPESEP